MFKISGAGKKMEVKTGIVLIIGAIIFLLAVVGIGRQILIPCQRLQTQLLEKTAALAAAQEKVGGMKDYQAQKQLLGKRLAEIDLHIDWEVRRGVNYYFIGQLAAAHQLTLVDIQPESTPEEKNCLQAVLQIALRGEYLQMISFLQALDAQLPNAVEIRRIKIEIDKKAPIIDPRPDLILTCQLVTFIKQNPANMRLNSIWTMHQGDVFFAPPGTEASPETEETAYAARAAQDEAALILPMITEAQGGRSISEDSDQETRRQTIQETDQEINEIDLMNQETAQVNNEKTTAGNPAANERKVGETDGFLIQKGSAPKGNYRFPLNE